MKTDYVLSQPLANYISCRFQTFPRYETKIPFLLGLKNLNVFTHAQVRWPNGHTNTYRNGAEGANDVLVHPAVRIRNKTEK